MSFGGRTWAINPADFRLAQISNSQCLGAFFQLTTGSSAPPWIVGDTFLKNVYSVYRYDPPAVGFAELSPVAIAMNGREGPIPTPTIGSAAPGVKATERSGSAAERLVLSAGRSRLLLVVAIAMLGVSLV